MNETVSLEADLHCEIGDKGDARKIQVKGGFMGFIVWIEENRGDQSVRITRHHRGTYGIARHQQLRENTREAGLERVLHWPRWPGTWELKVSELVSGWRRRNWGTLRESELSCMDLPETTSKWVSELKVPKWSQIKAPLDKHFSDSRSC